MTVKGEKPLELLPYRRRSRSKATRTCTYEWTLTPLERAWYKKAARYQGKPLSQLLHKGMEPYVALVMGRPQRKDAA